MELHRHQHPMLKLGLILAICVFTIWNIAVNPILHWRFWIAEGILGSAFFVTADFWRCCLLFYTLFLLSTASTARIAGFSGRNLRILPLGDSITWGYGSSDWNGYRQHLLTILEGNQVEFIGSGHTGRMYNNANEGRPGELVEQTMRFSGHILHQRPNVILLNIGSNDVVLHGQEDAAGKFRALLENITDICPDAVVVVSPLGPSTNDGYQTRMDALNADLPAIADSLVTQGRHVLLADTTDITVFDLFDDFHYMDQGYRKLASAFHRAIDLANFNGWIRDPVRIPRRELVRSTACESLPDWINLPDIFPGFESPPNNARYLWGDIDGNGRADFLVLAPDGRLQPYMNLPLAVPDAGRVIEWRPGRTIQTPVHGESESPILLTADLTGANRASLVYVYSNGSIFASMNAGLERGANEPKFLPPVLISDTSEAPADAQGIRFVDFDGDGRDDLAYLDPSGILQVWLNVADLYQHSSAEPDPEVLNIKWVSQGQIVGQIPGISRNDIRLADLNGDGLADFLLVDADSGTVEAWMNRGVEKWYQPPPSTNPTQVRLSPSALHPGVVSVLDAAKGAARGVANRWRSSFFSASKGKTQLHSIAQNTPESDKNTTSRYTPRTPWRWEELGVIIEGSDSENEGQRTADLRFGVGAPGIQFADIAGSRRASYLRVESHGKVSGLANGCGAQGAGWGWSGD